MAGSKDLKKGLKNLAKTLDGRMSEHTPTELILDFGEISGKYELTTNTFPVPIPKDDYSVCRQLTLGDAGGALCRVSAGAYEGTAYIPEKMRKLKPGDRVLVAWVQDEPVVVDIIVMASSL